MVRAGVEMGEHQVKKGVQEAGGRRQAKRLRVTNKNQMERGQTQGKKKVMKRMSVWNEKEMQVTLGRVRPGETESTAPGGSVAVILAASGTLNLPFPCFLSMASGCTEGICGLKHVLHLQVLHVLMKPRAASQVPWCHKHFSAPKVFSAFARQHEASPGKTPFWNKFCSSDFVWVGQCHRVLCLILQASSKRLLPPHHKPNVKNEFTFIIKHILEI